MKTIPIVLFALLFLACSTMVDVTPIVTKDIYKKVQEECDKSGEKGCVTSHFLEATKKYCLEKKLSETECDEFGKHVFLAVAEYQRQEMEEIKTVTNKLKEATRELKEGSR